MYRKGVGIFLINPKGQVFVAQRGDMSQDAMQMPQGGINDGEDIESALWREMMEEIGTNKANILARSRSWVSYDLPAELQHELWDGKFIGQKQQWFLLAFTGQDDDINIATPVPEFIAWHWADIKDLNELVVDFKKHVYDQVIKEFDPYIENYLLKKCS